MEEKLKNNIPEQKSEEQLYKARVKKGKHIGLFATIAFHLVLLIILLVISIHTVVTQETSFVTDSEGKLAQEQKDDKIQKEEEVKNLAKGELAEQLAGRSVQEYKSVPVQRSGSSLKDDRNSNMKELYKEAADVQKKVKDAKKYDIQPEGTDNVPNAAPVKKSDAKPYKGPSVLSWTLDRRNAFSLPIPVYKCQGGGDVSVRISVGRNGYVTSAQIIESSSVSDGCICAAALNAAKRSRFSASETAPNPQVGEIVYRFIAQ